MSTPLLDEQYSELLLRFRRHAVALPTAVAELHRLAHRPELVDDRELHDLLTRVAKAHRAGSLKTRLAGSWSGAPTGQAIAELLAVGQRKVRVVRDAYYCLYLGLAPFDANEPEPGREPPRAG
ncbi:hypothetical protein D5S17_23325 [Pseudonocardiaceae bacterium YIM PH 21723]|nr:hypothetical protein D5S17_23325 [Pseudonocardiaceae bacterium YIM PH 21723]